MIMGQGLVGNLVLQGVRQHLCEQIIVVDAIAKRCEMGLIFGADHAIDVNETDPVERVMELTDGRGADIVFECVGGAPGLKSFAQAQEMVCDGGNAAFDRAVSRAAVAAGRGQDPAEASDWGLLR